MKFGMWMVSVDNSKSSFGQQLLHLKYSTDSHIWKLRTLGLLTIGGPYIKERIFNLSGSNQSLRRVNSLMDGVETLIKILNIFTIVNFLRKGGSPSFLEYILNLIPVSTVPTSKRNVGYAYMTRELIWHGFIELLVIIIPLINYSKLKRKVTKMIRGSVSTEPSSLNCTFSTNSKCVLCGEPPILPHQMGCSHTFCFYCLATNRELDSSFECPECGFNNPESSAMKPVHAFS
ncbi:peroxisome biogenesis factor 2 isoform X2 [Halyomorpha halys]